MRARISEVSVIWLCIVTVQTDLRAPARIRLQQPGIQWKHLSSANGDLRPASQTSTATVCSMFSISHTTGKRRAWTYGCRCALVLA